MLIPGSPVNNAFAKPEELPRPPEHRKQKSKKIEEASFPKQASSIPCYTIAGDPEIVKKLQSDDQHDKQRRFNRIRAKVLSVARFVIILNRSRINEPELTKLKKDYPDGKLPPWSILNSINNPASL